jgi:hypothetical protein
MTLRIEMNQRPYISSDANLVDIEHRLVSEISSRKSRANTLRTGRGKFKTKVNLHKVVPPLTQDVSSGY